MKGLHFSYNAALAELVVTVYDKPSYAKWTADELAALAPILGRHPMFFCPMRTQIDHLVRRRIMALVPGVLISYCIDESIGL